MAKSLFPKAISKYSHPIDPYELIFLNLSLIASNFVFLVSSQYFVLIDPIDFSISVFLFNFIFLLSKKVAVLSAYINSSVIGL